MAATLRTPVACPLLAVPIEVRLGVYQYLFDGALLCTNSGRSSGSSCGHTVCSCAFPWQILGTCKQLRSEGLPYLLAATTLEFSSTMVNMAKIPSSYLSIIPKAIVLDAKAFSKLPLQLELLKELKVLELRNITIWCKYHDETYLDSEDGNESMYELAMFNLGRTSTSLVELCMRPGRTFSMRLCCQYVVSSLQNATIVSYLTLVKPKISISC